MTVTLTCGPCNGTGNTTVTTTGSNGARITALQRCAPCSGTGVKR